MGAGVGVFAPVVGLGGLVSDGFLVGRLPVQSCAQ